MPGYAVSMVRDGNAMGDGEEGGGGTDDVDAERAQMQTEEERSRCTLDRRPKCSETIS